MKETISSSNLLNNFQHHHDGEEEAEQQPKQVQQYCHDPITNSNMAGCC